jgi:16S rRNA (cytidine1402-2'-O)-methyltransferase
VRRGTLATLAKQYAGEAPPKGEIVVVVGPPLEKMVAPEDVDALLLSLLAGKSVRESADEAALLTGLSRRDLYQRALALKDRR